MRIGEIAKIGRVNVQTLRYYERRGLLAAARRSESGVRQYETDAVQRLRFIRRAQGLGFSLDEIRDLLALWVDAAESCTVTEARAKVALARIERKMDELQRMSAALNTYMSACQSRSELSACPLLSALGTEEWHPDE